MYSAPGFMWGLTSGKTQVKNHMNAHKVLDRVKYSADIAFLLRSVLQLQFTIDEDRNEDQSPRRHLLVSHMTGLRLLVESNYEADTRITLRSEACLKNQAKMDLDDVLVECGRHASSGPRVRSRRCVPGTTRAFHSSPSVRGLLGLSLGRSNIG